jgi:hypothetical protein
MLGHLFYRDKFDYLAFSSIVRFYLVNRTIGNREANRTLAPSRSGQGFIMISRYLPNLLDSLLLNRDHPTSELLGNVQGNPTQLLLRPLRDDDGIDHLDNVPLLRVQIKNILGVATPAKGAR